MVHEPSNSILVQQLALYLFLRYAHAVHWR